MSIGTNPAAIISLERNLVDELYLASNAKSYGISSAQWAEILAGVGAKAAGSFEAPHSSISNKSTSKGLTADFYRNLRLEELALARGCAAGNDNAWEVFLTRYREKLYDAARHITREDSSARELADSIYADLFGTSTRDGQRVSKLASYTGRGSLEGWLRTILAQEWVNRYRKQKREVSLDEESEDGAQFAAPQAPEARQVNQPVIVATDAALGELAAEDRYVLASYYLDKRTLAEIARVLRVHESTISRKVDKLGKSVRKKILEHLIKAGMSRRQAEEAMEFDVRDWPVDVRDQLERSAPNQALPGPILSVSAAQETGKETFQPVEGKKDQSSI